MSSTQNVLFDENLPTLIIDPKKLFKEYHQIGFGDEGEVYQYNDKIAFKIFDSLKYRDKLNKKLEKIEKLGKIHDEAACLPIGFIGYEDDQKRGYYCDLVNKSENSKDFDYLPLLPDLNEVYNYLIQADEAMQRFHKMDLIIGDVKEDNILIDQSGKVKFVDTDNWKYKDYDFDIYPSRIDYLDNTFLEEFSLLDSDRFLFAIIALESLIKKLSVKKHREDYYYKILVESMDTSKEVKEGLRLIFSSAHDKPYVGPILKKIDLNKPLMSKTTIQKLNNY